MSFKGVLKQGVQFTIEVGAVGTGPVAVTILKINHRDKVNAADAQSAVPGTGLSMTDQVAARIDRLMIFVNPTSGVGGTFKLTQGTNMFTEDIVGTDMTLVWDCTP